MAPVTNVTCLPAGMSSDGPRNFGKDDLDALLYIVVTLLFYSMGIIIGIITYLKREQAEMEEDKMFDIYMQVRREPLNLQKKERVQKMALYLKEIEEQKARKEKSDKKASESKQTQPKLQQLCKSCYRCTFQESHCPDCKAVPLLSNIRQCHAEVETCNVSLSQGKENIEGASVMSPSSPSMSEPLLTHDFKKKVAFPDQPVFRGTTISVPPSFRFGTLSWQFPAHKSAFKYSPNFVDRSRNSVSEPRDIYIDNDLDNENKNSCLEVIFPANLSGCTEDVLDKSSEEPIELRQFAASARLDYGKRCLQDEESSSGWDRSSCNTAIVSSLPNPGQHVASLSFTSPSLQTDKETCYTVHAECAKKDSIIQSLNNEEIPCLTRSDGNPQLWVSNLEFVPEREGALARSLNCNQLIRYNQHHKEFNLMQQPECESEKHQGPRSPNSKTILDELASSSLVSAAQSGDARSLQRSHSLQPPAVLRYQVKPHTFPGTHILRLLMDDESGILPSSSTDRTLPDDSSSPQHQSMLPSVKSGPQNFSKTSMTGSRKLGLEWRNKTNDKRLLPRSQPERRGALFFTQGSKDIESPKTSSRSKHSRLTNVFNRQENLDHRPVKELDNSETQDCQNDRSRQFFSTLTSGDSASLSPSPTGRDKKRNPRLTTSHTLDSFTYL